MNRLTKMLATFVGAMGVVATAIWLIAPREPVERVRFDASKLPADLDGYLASTESKVPNLRPGAAKGIVWAGKPGVKTPVALVYLHGFSASRCETSPVVEDVARTLGANVFFTRLTGHGQDAAAMGTATVGAWVQDAGEAVAIGRRLGDRVVVIATSTGAPIAVLGAEAGSPADAYVFVSPNFRLKDPMAALLTWPLARYWVPLVLGPESGFTPLN